MLSDYVIRTHISLGDIDATAWDALLSIQTEPSPFMRHAYLSALNDSGSACAETGWQMHCLCLSDAQGLAAACVIYLKAHSYGEYVFDWAWANAYAQHGLTYYPKAVVAVPFTPVPGSRLLARDDVARQALVAALLAWCQQHQLSSLHLLFASEADLAVCEAQGLMRRHTVQFHWTNTATGYRDFDEFLLSLTQEKRKKIRQEQRKVKDAGVRFEHRQGPQISTEDWDFFYQCYAQTYLEHGSTPYLNRAFFAAMQRDMPENWLLFIARKNGTPIASSLIGLKPASGKPGECTGVAYGRYWGAMERVDCLHFDACYYQALAWCIQNRYLRFEGGAQGEHKMARALLPIKTSSAHWLAHPAFADAVGRFLERESEGLAQAMAHLESRSPLRKA